MEELTIGQRIAQERKRQNLSQMALAARLEVSRQAISKWESDGAIPEIDKLIALSRLFGVRIGWLLGVETQAAAQEESLSEDQIRIIEELVRKYQTPPKNHTAVLSSLLAVAVSLLLFLVIHGQKEQLIQYRADIALLTERISALEDRGTVSRSLSVDTLLAQYTLTPATPVTEDSPYTGRGTSVVSLKAVPNGWHPDEEGWFHVQSKDGEDWEQKCLWNGTALTANVELPVQDGYEYSFVVRHTDGSQETQILPEAAAENLQSTFHIPGVHETGTMEFTGGTLILKNYTSTLTMPDLYQQERFEEPGYYSDPYPAAWQKAEYVLLVNDSVSGAAFYHLPVMDCGAGLYPEDAVAGTFTAAAPELRFESIQVTDTTMHAQLWLYVYLDNGLRERYLLNMFDYSENGTFTELPNP